MMIDDDDNDDDVDNDWAFMLLSYFFFIVCFPLQNCFAWQTVQLLMHDEEHLH